MEKETIFNEKYLNDSINEYIRDGNTVKISTVFNQFRKHTPHDSIMLDEFFNKLIKAYRSTNDKFLRDNLNEIGIRMIRTTNTYECLSSILENLDLNDFNECENLLTASLSSGNYLICINRTIRFIDASREFENALKCLKLVKDNPYVFEEYTKDDVIKHFLSKMDNIIKNRGYKRNFLHHYSSQYWLDKKFNQLFSDYIYFSKTYNFKY